MTVEDPPQHHQLLLPSPLTFFHAKIPFKHWQLRSLLCSPAPNLLYYPTEENIFALNPATKKREIIATLPFSPRCIGARYGWVCAGGVDNGQFASIRVGELGKLRSRRQGSDETVSLGMELGPENAGEGSGGSRRPEVKITDLGGTIVNSVTLHRPPSSNSDDDVVAVLTNNDKTVRIFHLAQNRVLTTLVLDIATNHASISPDGQHLVVIGDCPIVYFYRPASSSGSSCSTPGIGIGEAGCEWVLYSHPPLTAGTDALISTSFSPSSLLCAVASQDGSITIFDTRYLSCTNSPGCPSPIVKRIPSSRPKTGPGAVRSVQFSPAPWDLLVWAEHSGRVCVADARSNFTKRQVVEILVEKDDLIEAEVESVEDDDDIQSSRRRREGSTGRGYSREEEEEENDDTSPNMDNDVHAFFSHRFDEVQELVSRVRGANSHELWDTPRWNGTSNYSPSNRPSAVAAATANYPPYAPVRVPAIQPPSVSVPAPPSQPIHTSTPVLRDYRERQLERERARQRIHDPPRRRNSTHPSYTDQSTSTSPASAQLPIPITAPSIPPTIDSSPFLQRFPWNTGSEPIHTTNARPLETMFTDHQRNRELNALIADERRRGYITRRRAANVGSVVVEEDGALRLSYQEPEVNPGVDITGCTLSRDGSKLYVATNDGIVEYHVDLAGRKVFPSFTPR